MREIGRGVKRLAIAVVEWLLPYSGGNPGGQDNRSCERPFAFRARPSMISIARAQVLAEYFTAKHIRYFGSNAVQRGMGFIVQGAHMRGMVSGFLAALAATTVLAMPALAQNQQSGAVLTPKLAAICVQEQLNAAGYPVGRVDGDIGPRSIAAAEQFARDKGLSTLLLTPEDAERWCHDLAESDAELRPFLAKAVAELESQDAAYGAGGDFRYQIASNVPESQIDLVKTGLGLAEAYIEANLGGGIPQQVREGVTVKIVATGKGNEEYGGGGGTATAFAQAVMRPFFDVANQNWNQNTQGRGWSTRADSMKTVAHEYAHIWHGHLGAISGVHQPLPGWLNEGMAEYIGYRAMEASGDIRWSNAVAFMQNGAPQEQMKVPLHQIRIWAGQVGFIAINWLVDESPNGLLSLRIVGEEVGKGTSAKAAFRTAFGLELDSFYEQFEAWRVKVLENPRRGFEARPALVLAD